MYIATNRFESVETFSCSSVNGSNTNTPVAVTLEVTLADDVSVANGESYVLMVGETNLTVGASGVLNFRSV